MPTALVIAAILGIIFAVLETRGVMWVPSPTGIGIGMIVPAAVIFVMFLGGVVERIWAKPPMDKGNGSKPEEIGLLAEAVRQ